MDGIDGLVFEYAVLRGIFREQREWASLRDFVASTKYCRAHEAAALEARARKALICVEEVELNTMAAQIVRRRQESRTEYKAHLMSYIRYAADNFKV